MSDLKLIPFERKTFAVDAIEVTDSNIQEIAEWCDGQVKSDNDGADGAPRNWYIKVRVHRPMNERQTKAFVGDWVVRSKTGFKVYSKKALYEAFEEKH